MHKSNEDCFYFLTSTCAKGALCTFRHSPLALTCNVICPAWLRGNCPDPACAFRHSKIQQRQMISNGILCYFENTPTGCLKLDCTFIHSRPRMNLRNSSTNRPSSTNLVNKDSISSPSTDTNISKTNSESQPSTNSENQSSISIPINIDSSSINKTELTTRRVAVPSDIEQLNENDNNNLNKTTTRSVITDSSQRDQEETSTNQSRLIANRNVVISETSSTNIPIRKIVRTTSSNRVVVSSESIDLSPKKTKTDIDLNEQENKSKKLKKDVQKTVEISFPCSTQSITNRLLLMSSKETTSTNNTKPIRLKRDHLPATKTTNGNCSTSLSTSTNEEKTSAGTGLSQDDDERRSMRIERFQKKPTSPPRSNVNSTSSTNSNGRKRSAEETLTTNESTPKRFSTSTEKSIGSSSLAQPSSVVIKRSLIPPINSTKLTAENRTTNISTEDDENQLLKLNDSADIVDTFAAIDEALLEADHLLDLM